MVSEISKDLTTDYTDYTDKLPLKLSSQPESTERKNCAELEPRNTRNTRKRILSFQATSGYQHLPAPTGDLPATYRRPTGRRTEDRGQRTEASIQYSVFSIQ